MTKVTRTSGPLHFEDLEPHRFEDMVRQLIYDFRDWQNIEATGKGGSDDGFDVRAWEKAYSQDEEQEDEETIPHPMEGNLWMIQCKREKQIGPKEVVKIIEKTVDIKSPPYGYILVAATDFSKTSFDKFRESLRSKGVQEFYLWGKSALEDMLYMPKNDRILFTFLGVSMTSQRRSKRSKIRFSVINKNKLIKIFGDNQSNRLHKSILVRDIKDTYYPWKDKCKDFDKNPRWKECFASHFHPLGLCCEIFKYYAYIDRDKKEWDFTSKIDLLDNMRSDHRFSREKSDRGKIEDFWDYIPNKYKIIWEREGVIKFEDMEVIDDKGDVKYDFPHLFVDFRGSSGAFYGFLNKFRKNEQENHFNPEDYKRIKVFPEEFSDIKKGIVHKDKAIELNQSIFHNIKNVHKMDLIAIDDRYSFLRLSDEIALKTIGVGGKSEKIAVKVLFKNETTVQQYLQDHDQFSQDQMKAMIQGEVGRNVNNDDKLLVLEFKRSHNWDLEKPEGQT